VLKWAREHGCPWNEGTCARAARGGHLNVLRWAWEHDRPWNEDSYVFICRSGRTFGRAAVGAGAPLPMGREDV